MSIVIIAAILVGAVAALCLLLILIDNKQKRKTRDYLLHRFSQLGTENNLSFSSQEIFKHSIIGLDGLQRKLAILSGTPKGTFHEIIINLDEVKNLSVRKIHRSIPIGDSKNKKTKDYLERIVLAFEFRTDKQPVEISFFHHIDNHIYQFPELEQKAKHWEKILSKMLNAPLKKIA
jgi:hypothetical protein